jgi:gluconolactonase
VSFLNHDGSRSNILDRFNGKLLNSPNDLVVKSDGAIYFTDPPYGIYPSSKEVVPENWYNLDLKGKEQPCNGVYRLNPDGTIHLLADDFKLPNGLAFSPDEKILYVDDSEERHIRAFDVESDGSLNNSRVFLDMSSSDLGAPDGMKVDTVGNIFCTGPGGIWVCSPAGDLLGRILLPEQPANLAWGEEGNVLFITARTSVYRLETLTSGKI